MKSNIKTMYTLIFPFRLPLGQKITTTDQPEKLGDLNIFLEKRGHCYVIKIDGFSSEEAAREYINNVWSGLRWVLLNQELVPNAILNLQKVTYADDAGGKVDGMIDDSGPAIYQTEKKIRICTLRTPTITASKHANDVMRFFIEGASYSQSERLLKDKKLQVALDLYGAYFIELSANAKFLSLVMTLEALATGILRTRLVLDLLDKWKKETERIKKGLESDTEDYLSLDTLEQNLLFRKKDSIKRQIHRLVYDTLNTIGDKNANEEARIALKVYDQRSTLLHTGILDKGELNEATRNAKRIVDRVLKAKFRLVVGDINKIDN